MKHRAMKIAKQIDMRKIIPRKAKLPKELESQIAAKTPGSLTWGKASVCTISDMF